MRRCRQRDRIYFDKKFVRNEEKIKYSIFSNQFNQQQGIFEAQRRALKRKNNEVIVYNLAEKISK